MSHTHNGALVKRLGHVKWQNVIIVRRLLSCACAAACCSAHHCTQIRLGATPNAPDHHYILQFYMPQPLLTIAPLSLMSVFYFIRFHPHSVLQLEQFSQRQRTDEILCQSSTQLLIQCYQYIQYQHQYNFGRDCTDRSTASTTSQ